MTWKLRWKLNSGESFELKMFVGDPTAQAAMQQLKWALINTDARDVELLRETPGWEPVP